MNIHLLTYHRPEHTAMQQNTCPRCNGRGFIEIYRHVENGVCFLCRGDGVYTGLVGHNALHTSNQSASKLHTKRWFLGYLSNDDTAPKQIFAYTADDFHTGKTRAERELSALGQPTSPKPERYCLLIGSIDETKKELMARYRDYLRGK